MNAVVRNRSTVLLELANSTQWTVQVLARGNSAGGNPQTQRGALKKAASASALALHSISTSPRPIYRENGIATSRIPSGSCSISAVAELGSGSAGAAALVSVTKATHERESQITPEERRISGRPLSGSARGQRHLQGAMGRSDEFHWVTDAEPHSTRRREILAKHGDKVRKLYGYDHSTAWQVSGPFALTNGYRWAFLVRADGICYCSWTSHKWEHAQNNSSMESAYFCLHSDGSVVPSIENVSATLAL